MSNDIVKRLRDWENCNVEGSALAESSADEIERLRESVIEAQQHRHAAECNLEAAHATVMRLRAPLASVVKHWREFGPEHGFDETLERAALAAGAEPASTCGHTVSNPDCNGCAPPPASASPTMDQGPWTVFRDDVSGYPIGIGSDDFKRDVLLRVDGDFGCATEKADYCGWLANVLNGAANCKHCPHCGQWHNLDLGC